MSLGIAFKGAEGIVLAADSRVTLTTVSQTPMGPVAIPSTFDNATKLLRVSGHKYVGAITYGLGAIGTTLPRTAHSFMPEFEAALFKKYPKEKRISVELFATDLSEFFQRQWTDQKMSMTPAPGTEMVFIVGGYDEDEPYGRLFEITIPTQPKPKEQQTGSFGLIWGGQREFTDRLITGFDPRLPELTKQFLKLTDDQRGGLEAHLKTQLQAPIPFQFLPLQDCVDLAILLIKTTITVQTFLVGVRGVGGQIDLATITRTDGLEPIQLKALTGEFGKIGKPGGTRQ